MAAATTTADPSPPTGAAPPKQEEAAGSDPPPPLPPAASNLTPAPESELKEAAAEEEQKPAAVDAPEAQATTKKRKLSNSDAVNELSSSAYFKIRSIIRDLRPFFIEVIHAPEFGESQAVNEIRKRMKTMLDLSRQFRNEASSAKLIKPEEQLSSGAAKENLEEQKPQAPQSQNAEHPTSANNPTQNASVHDDKPPATAPEETMSEVKDFAKQLEENVQGTYVVGGSPIGWNFLLYPGSKASYYGESKESFRSRQPAE